MHKFEHSLVLSDGKHNDKYDVYCSFKLKENKAYFTFENTHNKNIYQLVITPQICKQITHPISLNFYELTDIIQASFDENNKLTNFSYSFPNEETLEFVVRHDTHVKQFTYIFKLTKIPQSYEVRLEKMFRDSVGRIDTLEHEIKMIKDENNQLKLRMCQLLECNQNNKLIFDVFSELIYASEKGNMDQKEMRLKRQFMKVINEIDHLDGSLAKLFD